MESTRTLLTKQLRKLTIVQRDTPRLPHLTIYTGSPNTGATLKLHAFGSNSPIITNVRATGDFDAAFASLHEHVLRTNCKDPHHREEGENACSKSHSWEAVTVLPPALHEALDHINLLLAFMLVGKHMPTLQSPTGPAFKLIVNLFHHTCSVELHLEKRLQPRFERTPYFAPGCLHLYATGSTPEVALEELCKNLMFTQEEGCRREAHLTLLQRSIPSLVRGGAPEASAAYINRNFWVTKRIDGYVQLNWATDPIGQDRQFSRTTANTIDEALRNALAGQRDCMRVPSQEAACVLPQGHNGQCSLAQRRSVAS